jgi:hypothetical protein
VTAAAGIAWRPKSFCNSSGSFGTLAADPPRIVFDEHLGRRSTVGFFLVIDVLTKADKGPQRHRVPKADVLKDG